MLSMSLTVLEKLRKQILLRLLEVIEVLKAQALRSRQSRLVLTQIFLSI